MSQDLNSTPVADAGCSPKSAPVVASIPAPGGKAERRSMTMRSVQSTLSHLGELVDKLLAGDVPHGMVTRFLTLIGWTLDDFAGFVRERRAHLVNSLETSLHNPFTHQRVPRVIHRMWITSADDPAMPPDEYLDALFTGMGKLSASWAHVFWTNSPPVAKHVETLARAAGRSLATQPFDVLGNLPAHSLLKQLIGERKFVLAADVAKFLVLDRFGGLYCDLGIAYSQEILDIAEVSDMSVLLGSGSFFQVSLLACPPSSPISSLFLGFLNKPELLSRKVVVSGSQVCSLDEVNAMAGPGFTACLLLFWPPHARLAILPPQSSYLAWRSQKSWYGSEGKHGNVLVRNTQPTLLSEERYLASRTAEERNVRTFGISAALGEKLRMITGLAEHFASNPTDLCDILHYYGSDKAKGWHNYAYVYAYVLSRFVGRGAKILEVGLGTNFTDIQSSMGASGRPGASLRAWREFFINAEIYGADIDRRVLFEEPSIQTFFVDQTRADTFVDLFGTLGQMRFDLIIDDGLHTFAANRTMLLSSIGQLAEGGLYIVEDIRAASVPQWQEFLPGLGQPAAIVTLRPNSSDDNRFVIIEPNPTKRGPNN